ncbi:MAG: hypothetical protein ABIZ04_15825 [Opitutus sp.]
MIKPLYFLAAVFAATTTVFCAVSDRPPFSTQARAAQDEFEQRGSEHHRWKKGQTFPESLAEVGLLPDATLVWSGLYKDGGTTGYLLEDSGGNFLAICTGPGFQTKDHPLRIDARLHSRLFIGGLHYTKKTAEMVPHGSKAEAWLRNLLEDKKKAKHTSEPSRL